MNLGATRTRTRSPRRCDCSHTVVDESVGLWVRVQPLLLPGERVQSEGPVSADSGRARGKILDVGVNRLIEIPHLTASTRPVSKTREFLFVVLSLCASRRFEGA